MAADFRKLERAIFEFFRTRGMQPANSRGDFMLGVCTTEAEEKWEKGGLGSTAQVVVPEEHKVIIISLSDLAQELAEEFA